MNSFDFDAYDDNAIANPNIQEYTPQKMEMPRQNEPSFDFDSYDPAAIPNIPNEEEGFIKSGLRKGLQIAQGRLETTLPGLALSTWQLLGMGEALDESEIDRLENIAEQMGVPFDREKYLQGAQAALEHVPTVANIGRGIENYSKENLPFEIPLTPKTTSEKALRIGANVSGFTKGSLPHQATMGGLGSATYAGLTAAGVPEPAAEILTLGIGGATGKFLEPYTPRPYYKTHPSGLKQRNYEGLKDVKTLTNKGYDKLQLRIIDDFKDVSKTILDESPYRDIKTILENDPRFKSSIEEEFRELKNLADTYPTIKNDDLKTSLESRFKKNLVVGVAASEFDKDYSKVMQSFIKDIESGDSSPKDLITRYRKNNSELTPMYEPGQSKLYNRAKKSALLDFNRAIADTLKQYFPDSELVNLFESKNKIWSEIMDVEAIDEYLDDLTAGKFQFQKGKKFFDSPNQARPFKRLLGEQKFKQFEQLMFDMQKTEKTNKLLRQAKAQGWDEVAKTAASYLIHPYAAVTKGTWEAGKFAWKQLITTWARMPKIGIKLGEGMNAFKAGDFKAADKAFKTVKAEIIEAQKPKAQPEAPTTVHGKAERIQPKELPAPEKPLAETKQVPTVKPTPAQKPKKSAPKTQPIKSQKKKIVKSPTVKNIQKSNRPDITPKGLKEQKDYFIRALEDALSKPMESTHINIEIPGDGKFKIKNQKDSLEEALKKVKGKWPTKPLSKPVMKAPPYKKEQVKTVEEEYRKELEAKKPKYRK